jgi:hypothetical protein
MDNEQNLPEGITKEMITEAKRKHRSVKVADLLDAEGNYIDTILVGNPTTFIQNEWEKFIDKDLQKAKGILINGCVPCAEHKEMIKGLEKNSDAYMAVFEACAKMLPVGKAVLKNV